MLYLPLNVFWLHLAALQLDDRVERFFYLFFFSVTKVSFREESFFHLCKKPPSRFPFESIRIFHC